MVQLPYYYTFESKPFWNRSWIHVCSLDLTGKNVQFYFQRFDNSSETVVVYENLNTSVKTKEVPKVESMSGSKNESKF